jgi:hypothetical protein
MRKHLLEMAAQPLEPLRAYITAITRTITMTRTRTRTMTKTKTSHLHRRLLKHAPTPTHAHAHAHARRQERKVGTTGGLAGGRVQREYCSLLQPVEGCGVQDRLDEPYQRAPARLCAHILRL